MAFDVGYTNAGEWIQYKVNVTTPGSYTLQARVATGAAATGKTFNGLLNDTLIGTIMVPNTGGWQTWQTVSVLTPNLTTGIKTMRIALTSGDLNINYLNFISNTTITAPVISSASTDSGTVGSTFSYAIAASNNPILYNVTNQPCRVEFEYNDRCYQWHTNLCRSFY